MKDIDPDALTIDSWHEYALACFKAGETWRFRKKLSEHIWLTNRGAEAQIREYCVRRQGEWAREELDRVIADKKRRRDMQFEWRILNIQMLDVLVSYINNFDKKLF